MKFLKYFLITTFVFIQCSGFQKKESLYTDAELPPLEKTLNILEYGFGYDSETELNYVYAYSYSNTNFDKKEKELAEYIKGMDFNTLVSLYDKMVKIRAMTGYKISRYKELSEWRYYTFLQKELYTPLDKYTQLLRKNIIKRDPSIEARLLKEEYKLKKQAVQSYVQKEDIIDIF